jgi:membrane protease YdiL (CAAX protease family)
MTIAPGSFNWREFWILLVGGVVGAVALLPYALTLQASRLTNLPLPLPVLIPIQLVQNAIFLGALIAVGLYLGQRTELGAPLLERWLAGDAIGDALAGVARTALPLGLLTGAVIIALDAVIFAPRVTATLTQQPVVPVWKGLMASLYGGITEELLMRLGVFTAVAWLLGKLSHTATGPLSTSTLWGANVLVAVLFGLGHLPATARLVPITALVVVRAVTLNGIAGLVFGYLYWSLGLEAAMLAHFVTDVVLQGIGPALRLGG